MSWRDQLAKRVEWAKAKAESAKEKVDTVVEHHRERTKASQVRDKEHYRRESERWKYRAHTAHYKAQVARYDRYTNKYSDGYGSGSIGVNLNPNFGGFLMGGVGTNRAYRPSYKKSNSFGWGLVQAGLPSNKRTRKRKYRRTRR